MAYHMRGCAHAELDAFQKALEDFGRAIALDPEDIDSLRNRAVMYLELGEPEKAVQDYDEVIRLDPDDLSVREERQRALEEAEAEGNES